MTERFALIYRVSNTANWRVFGFYGSQAEAVAARKQAIAAGFKAAPTATTQGKILGWNIRPAFEGEEQ